MHLILNGNKVIGSFQKNGDLEIAFFSLIQIKIKTAFSYPGGKNSRVSVAVKFASNDYMFKCNI